jgi:hypothetical protein
VLSKADMRLSMLMLVMLLASCVPEAAPPEQPAQDLGANDPPRFVDVIAAADRWVVVGDEIAVSSDGREWTFVELPAHSPFRAVTATEVDDGEPRRLLAITADSVWASDDDGDTWRMLGVPGFELLDVAASYHVGEGGGVLRRFVLTARSTSGESVLLMSPDGIDWTRPATPLEMAEPRFDGDAARVIFDVAGNHLQELRGVDLPPTVTLPVDTIEAIGTAEIDCGIRLGFAHAGGQGVMVELDGDASELVPVPSDMEVRMIEGQVVLGSDGIYAVGTSTEASPRGAADIVLTRTETSTSWQAVERRLPGTLVVGDGIALDAGDGQGWVLTLP